MTVTATPAERAAARIAAHRVQVAVAAWHHGRDFRPADPDCIHCDGAGCIVFVDDDGFCDEWNCSCIQRSREETAEWERQNPFPG